jgi:hypothetical protein
MLPLFRCKIEYFPSFHLLQIYYGFEKLRKLGIISAKYKRVNGSVGYPLIKVMLDEKYTVIYDELDGLNWKGSTVEENLNYFQNNFNADFLFKRSFSKQMLQYAPDNCKVFPLGLNFPFKAEGRFPDELKVRVLNKIRNSSLFIRLHQKSIPDIDEIEFVPHLWSDPKILFTVRLWDPDKFKSEKSKVLMEKLNKDRSEYIKACKKEFGKRFIGGIIKDSFSEKYAPDLILPFSLTKKNVFLQNVKSANICVATSGLSDSTGWKFAEYVAASRAIVSEPLHYQLPGKFADKKNYLSFNNEDELLGKICYLLDNPELQLEMMKNNFEYYQKYVRSDMLVLNTLLTVKQNIKQ